MNKSKCLNKIILVGITPIAIAPTIIASKCNNSQNNNDKTDKINDNKIKEQVQNLNNLLNQEQSNFNTLVSANIDKIKSWNITYADRLELIKSSWSDIKPEVAKKNEKFQASQAQYEKLVAKFNSITLNTSNSELAELQNKVKSKINTIKSLLLEFQKALVPAFKTINNLDDYLKYPFKIWNENKTAFELVVQNTGALKNQINKVKLSINQPGMSELKIQQLQNEINDIHSLINDLFNKLVDIAKVNNNDLWFWFDSRKTSIPELDKVKKWGNGIDSNMMQLQDLINDLQAKSEKISKDNAESKTDKEHEQGNTESNKDKGEDKGESASNKNKDPQTVNKDTEPGEGSETQIASEASLLQAAKEANLFHLNTSKFDSFSRIVNPTTINLTNNSFNYGTVPLVRKSDNEITKEDLKDMFNYIVASNNIYEYDFGNRKINTNLLAYAYSEWFYKNWKYFPYYSVSNVSLKFEISQDKQCALKIHRPLMAYDWQGQSTYKESFNNFIKNGLSLIKPGMKDYDKAFVLWRYTSSYLEYILKDILISIEKAVLFQSGVCANYAHLYSLLLNIAGVTAMPIVTGKGVVDPRYHSEAHEFVYIKLQLPNTNQSMWYLSDATWAKTSMLKYQKTPIAFSPQNDMRYHEFLLPIGKSYNEPLNQA
ncbi:hypothetical protein [Mycoplasma sp. Z473B]|uniref:hypothetical protein n=1 Tax=Mycoplasma sp. Z473B TaxID=3401667 RepID=UPI003AAB5D87